VGLLDALEFILLQKAEKLFNSSTVVGTRFAKKSIFTCADPEYNFSAPSDETDADPLSAMRVRSTRTSSLAAMADVSCCDFKETTISAGLGSFSLIAPGCPSAPAGALMSLGSGLAFFLILGKPAWLF
jgi:hypothetical protein